MKTNGVVVDARNAMAQITVEIKVNKGSLFLVKLGVAIIKLGAWVAGVGEVKTEDSP